MKVVFLIAAVLCALQVALAQTTSPVASAQQFHTFTPHLALATTETRWQSLQPCHGVVFDWSAQLDLSSTGRPTGCYSRIFHGVNARGAGADIRWSLFLDPTLELDKAQQAGPGESIFITPQTSAQWPVGHWETIISVSPDGEWALVSEQGNRQLAPPGWTDFRFESLLDAGPNTLIFWD